MKLANDPLISIITVVYNSVNTLERTILSVINQTYENIEYIIIDGGSVDGSVDIIKRYQHKLAFWKSEKDNGIYYAMNEGLSHASGSLIAILNSDDWYELNTVELIARSSLIHSDIDVFHGLLKFINLDGSPSVIRGHYCDFLNKGMIEHPTCFIKRSLYEKVGEFNIMYRSAADYDWMLRAKQEGANFMLLPVLFTNFSKGGISDSYFGFLEELKIKRKYNLISEFKCFYWSVFTRIKSLIKS